MANYIADKRQGGVNPYHFVRLGGEVIRQAPQDGTLTGVIHCRLKTTRPLCIPDMPKAKIDENKHKTAPFFKVDDQPVIPGSELRGVIRSAFEALNNSCLSVNNNNHLTARSAEVRQPGILRYESDGQWHLYQATARKMGYDGEGSFTETADTIQREWINFKYIKGQKVPDADGKKRKHRVLYKFSTEFISVDAEELEKAVRDYSERVCDLYKKNDKPKNNGRCGSIKPFIRKLLPRKDGKCYPVYYLEKMIDGVNRVYLSPAQLSRSVFHRRLSDLAGSHTKCVRSDCLCEACRLFGMIADRKQQPSKLPAAVASRLRFTDAQCITAYSFKERTLKELASPKISAVELYSTAPEMQTLWTYDTPGVQINGRKFYFHHKSDFLSTEKNQRNMTAELLDTGAEFAFDVYYDHLTKEELHKFLWTLTIGENNPDGKQQHKIGHGKPLGLGSAKITVESVIRRTFNPETLEYAEEPDTADYYTDVPFDADADYSRDFMHMTDFTFLGKQHVQYPYGDESAVKTNSNTNTGTLVWFKGNHNAGQPVNAGESCTISYSLPRLTDNPGDLALPALICGQSGGGNSTNGNRNGGYNGGHSGGYNGGKRKR